MHILSGLFLKTEGIKEIHGKKYYMFTIIGTTKNRDYCDNEEDYNYILYQILVWFDKTLGELLINDNYEYNYAIWRGFCGVCARVTGPNCAIDDDQTPETFVKDLIIEIFGSALGIFGIFAGIIQANNANGLSKST